MAELQFDPGSLTPEPVYSIQRADNLARKGNVHEQRDGEVSPTLICCLLVKESMVGTETDGSPRRATRKNQVAEQYAQYDATYVKQNTTVRYV